MVYYVVKVNRSKFIANASRSGKVKGDSLGNRFECAFDKVLIIRRLTYMDERPFGDLQPAFSSGFK